MIPATAPWDDSSQQKTFTLPIRVDSNEWYTVYIIQIMNNQLVGEIAAVRTSCDCGMIRFEDSMRWPLVVSIPSPVNSSPEIKKKHAPNALSLLLNGSTSSWDHFRFIIYNSYVILLFILHSPKTNSESPWKNGWNWNNYDLFLSFCGLGLISGEFAVSFRVSITVKCLFVLTPFFPSETPHHTPQTTRTLGSLQDTTPKTRPTKKGGNGTLKISHRFICIVWSPPK